MTTLKIKDARKGPILGGHPWVFSGALETPPADLPHGEPIRLVDSTSRFLATGYYNGMSQISVRLWGRKDNEPVDRAFFLRRIARALNLRQRLLQSELTDSYRLINAENDYLPGLVVDKYSDWLVLQCHTRGIDRWKPLIVEALVELLKPKGIYERSDISARKIEGLGPNSGLLMGEVPDIITIRENGLQFLVDAKQGQKTGFFLDQRDKRQALMKYSPGRKVLNAFAYTGGFSVYALKAGAAQVTSLDVSAPAMELARQNIRLNGLDEARCEFVTAEAKGYLRSLAPNTFDVIVLDPPAFIKDRRKVPEGLVGYRGINESALRALPEEGGILLTCSCSAHLAMREFRYMVSEAGGATGRVSQVTEALGHGIDHPVLVPFTEGQYLKCLILQT